MRAAIAFICVALTLSCVARANSDDVFDKAKDTLQGLDGPSATSSGPSNSAKISAQASGDTSQASSQLSHLWAITSAGALSANLLAAAPFSDSNAPKPDIGSVSNLTAGVNTRLDTSWIFLPGALTEDETNSATTDYNAICDEFISKSLGGNYYYNATPARQKADPRSTYAIGLFDKVATCQDLAQGSNLADFVKQANVGIAAQNKSKAAGTLIPLLEMQTGWRNAAKIARGKFSKFETNRPSTVCSLGLSLLGNEHSYSYVNAASPSKVIKDSTEGYGFGITGAVFFNRVSLLGGFSYERPYKSGQGQQVCSPVGTTTSTSCSTATVGAPTRTTARIISAEARTLVTNTLALGPRLEYDTASSNYGIKLPVYFVPNAKKVLTGGLTVGWTKQNRYQGAITIQKAFSFWN
jgi:hypothetical protein